MATLATNLPSSNMDQLTGETAKSYLAITDLDDRLEVLSHWLDALLTECEDRHLQRLQFQSLKSAVDAVKPGHGHGSGVLQMLDEIRLQRVGSAGEDLVLKLKDKTLSFSENKDLKKQLEALIYEAFEDFGVDLAKAEIVDFLTQRANPAVRKFIETIAGTLTKKAQSSQWVTTAQCPLPITVRGFVLEEYQIPNAVDLVDPASGWYAEGFNGLEWVCSPVILLEQLRRVTGQDTLQQAVSHHRLAVWDFGTQHWVIQVVSEEWLRDPDAIKREWVGLQSSNHKAVQKLMMTMLQKNLPLILNALTVDHTGMYTVGPDTKVFAVGETMTPMQGTLPDGIRVVLHHERPDALESLQSYRTQGSADVFKRTLLLASEKRPLIKGLSSFALTGPLMARLPFFTKSHIWNLGGRSSGGKSVADKLALACYRDPANYISWNTTAVGAEHLLASQNQTISMLDDISQIKDRHDLKQFVARMIYQIYEGKGRNRGAKTGGTQKMVYWNQPVLSSVEWSLLNSDGIKGTGAEARLIETFGTPWESRSEAMGDMVRDIEMTISENYGWAGRDWLRYLASHPDAFGVDEYKRDLPKMTEMLNRVIPDKAYASRLAPIWLLTLYASSFLARWLHDDSDVETWEPDEAFLPHVTEWNRAVYASAIRAGSGLLGHSEERLLVEAVMDWASGAFTEKSRPQKDSDGEFKTVTEWVVAHGVAGERTLNADGDPIIKVSKPSLIKALEDAGLQMKKPEELLPKDALVYKHLRINGTPTWGYEINIEAMDLFHEHLREAEDVEFQRLQAKALALPQ